MDNLRRMTCVCHTLTNSLRILIACFVVFSPIAAIAGSASVLQAFNDSPASNSPACQGMIEIGNVLAVEEHNAPVIEGHKGFDMIDYAKMANAAKVCGFDARGTDAERLPKLMNTMACGALKAHFTQLERVIKAQTSWACGWPSPVPGYRPVPGMMPPAREQR